MKNHKKTKLFAKQLKEYLVVFLSQTYRTRYIEGNIENNRQDLVFEYLKQFQVKIHLKFWNELATITFTGTNRWDVLSRVDACVFMFGSI